MKSDEEIGRELPRIIDFIRRYVLSFPSQEGWILMWWHGCVRWRWAGNV